MLRTVDKSDHIVFLTLPHFVCNHGSIRSVSNSPFQQRLKPGLLKQRVFYVKPIIVSCTEYNHIVFIKLQTIFCYRSQVAKCANSHPVGFGGCCYGSGTVGGCKYNFLFRTLSVGNRKENFQNRQTRDALHYVPHLPASLAIYRHVLRQVFATGRMLCAPFSRRHTWWLLP